MGTEHKAKYIVNPLKRKMKETVKRKKRMFSSPLDLLFVAIFLLKKEEEKKAK